MGCFKTGGDLEKSRKKKQIFILSDGWGKTGLLELELPEFTAEI